MLKIGVLASGRGSNLQSIIDEIEAGNLGDVKISVVLSDKENAKALKRAEKNNIKNIFVDPKNYDSKKEYEKKLIEILEENEVELVVMAGFMRIMTSYFINYYHYRVLNIHPSLLPSFRGLDAQKQALDYGAKVAGCTVHFASEKMDDGPIILQKAVEVKEDDTVDSLSRRILKEEHCIYPEAIRLYSEGKLEIEGNKVIIRRG